MVQHLRALVALAQDSTVTWWLTILCNPSSRESDLLLWPLGYLTCGAHTYMQANHPYT